MGQSVSGKISLPTTDKESEGKICEADEVVPLYNVSSDNINSYTSSANAAGSSVVAGHIKHFVGKWKELTCDSAILSAVAGYKIEFIINPVQITKPNLIKMSPQDAYHVDSQIGNFLQKGIIVASSHEQGEFISNIFLRPKKDGSFRTILNLKELNKFVQYHHFKMESIHMCTQLMQPGCYMAFIDLQDA